MMPKLQSLLLLTTLISSVFAVVQYETPEDCKVRCRPLFRCDERRKTKLRRGGKFKIVLPSGRCCPICVEDKEPGICPASCPEPKCGDRELIFHMPSECCARCIPIGRVGPESLGKKPKMIVEEEAIVEEGRDCDTVLCAMPNCQDAFTPEGECCPKCPSAFPNCENVKCALEPGGECEDEQLEPVIMPGECCPTCRPRCPTLSCKDPCFNPSTEQPMCSKLQKCNIKATFEIIDGHQCPQCPEFVGCDDIPLDCPVPCNEELECEQGLVPFTPPGECCPAYCKQDCKLVKCAQHLECGDGFVSFTPPDQCCARCCQEVVCVKEPCLPVCDCDQVACPVLACGKDEEARTLNYGDCCEFCVPKQELCDPLACPALACGDHEEARTLNDGDCCEVCVQKEPDEQGGHECLETCLDFECKLGYVPFTPEEECCPTECRPDCSAVEECPESEGECGAGLVFYKEPHACCGSCCQQEAQCITFPCPLPRSCDCDQVICPILKCGEDEEARTLDDGDCCEVCLPKKPNCSAVSCPALMCRPGYAPFTYEGQCCPTECKLDCKLVLCEEPTCEDPFTPDGECCPRCPDCSNVEECPAQDASCDEAGLVFYKQPTACCGSCCEKVECVKEPCLPIGCDCDQVICPILECGDDEEARAVNPGDCCEACLPKKEPKCSAVSCLKHVCEPGQDMYIPDGECCPVCRGNHPCSGIKCALPICSEGEFHFTPPDACCPICMEKEDCNRVDCMDPFPCEEGQVSVTPPGQCCPICIDENPACDEIACQKMLCPYGYFKPADECCWQCRPDCLSVVCPACVGPTPPGQCCPSCGFECIDVDCMPKYCNEDEEEYYEPGACCNSCRPRGGDE